MIKVRNLGKKSLEEVIRSCTRSDSTSKKRKTKPEAFAAGAPQRNVRTHYPNHEFQK